MVSIGDRLSAETGRDEIREAAVAIVRHANPFHPTFGRPPHTLAGRDEAMRRCRAAMSAGPDHPDYSMLLKGPRGSGKTVLLAAVRDMAEQNGLATVRVTAKPEPTFADALIEQVTSASDAERRRVSSAQISVLGSGAGVSFRAPESRELSVHTRMLDAMEHLADRAQRNGKGALITIDEFHNANIAALRDFAHALQDVAKIDGKPVMFVGAGLPSMEETALADQGMTFFQRIARTQLDPLSPEESAEALRAPIEAAGGTIGDEALTTAAAATSGYPFMVQLVGYHSWERCADPGGAITPDDVRAAIGAATGDMEVQVFAPMVRDLSDTDRLVLDAMSAFDLPEIKLSDVARAAGKTSNYLSVYIERLREAGVIDRPARGRVRFVHATMRDWLQRQRVERGAAVGGSGRPETTTTVKERIIATCRSNPEATHAAIAARVGTSPDYVGRVRRADSTSSREP
ncbi:MAG: AAA family ATPase [Acidimicrobiia bacterium]|nr:AAA family ATPase [Acidimicrobiia bacterium]MYC44990.1 AAA family ATPase [Acidimicrobiia bacterium]